MSPCSHEGASWVQRLGWPGGDSWSCFCISIALLDMHEGGSVMFEVTSSGIAVWCRCAVCGLHSSLTSFSVLHASFSGCWATRCSVARIGRRAQPPLLVGAVPKKRRSWAATHRQVLTVALRGRSQAGS